MISKEVIHSDLLIIGAGIFGTSTAYHYGQLHPDRTITIVDRTPSPPSHAASTDINKIVRADYTVPFYMKLAQDALTAWRTWPELQPFYHQTGWVALNETGSDTCSRIRANFRNSSSGHDPTEDLSLDELPHRFGGTIFSKSDLSGCDSSYWNPEAGWADAGSATARLLESAQARGNVRSVQGDVISLRREGDQVVGAELHDGKLLTADKVLMCTGAWTSYLLTPLEEKLAISQADRVEQQVCAAGVAVAHYQLTPTELESIREMPVIIYAADGDCQPPPPMGPGLLKVTNSRSFFNTITTEGGSRVSVPPLERSQMVISEKLKEETRRVVSKRLVPQFASREEAYWRLCWDAVTPLQDHLITAHPDQRLKGLFLAVGGSFHSYKFLPNIGKYVVNVLEGKSNGTEMDDHWSWKKLDGMGRGAHEKVYPTRELQDLED